MAKLYLVRGEYGSAFFERKGQNEAKLVHYIHENDGDYRPEYFDPLIKYFGGEVVPIEFMNLTANEMAALAAMES